MFNDGTVGGSADISVFNFSPRVVKQVEGNCSYCISYPPSKFRQSGSQWWHLHSILYIPPQKKIKGSEVRRTRWPLLHFSGNLLFKKFVTSLWKCGVALSCWKSMSLVPCSSKTSMTSTWDAILTTVSVALQVKRFGNSSGMNYKIDHITCSNAFSFQSCAF
jgi:hypothetical protein